MECVPNQSGFIQGGVKTEEKRVRLHEGQF